MIAEQYRKMLDAKSVIRQLSEKATKRAQIIGAENVFDYSLGNPSVPAPAEFKQALLDLIEKEDPMTLHGYSPTLGIPSVKTAIAESLNCRFDMNYGPEHIFPVSAAAAAIAHALRAVTVPGDEVLTFAPFFPEYHPYVDLTGAVLKVVPADTKSFQINFEAFEEMLGPRVAAVLVNTPNNPSGAVYSAETLTKLAEVLTRKAEQYGHDIFLISDEPYREIVFDGKQQPYVSKFYANTISCYSFSKALSLPGERIGYLAVNPACPYAAEIVNMCGQISRGIGHNCPTSLMQLAVSKVLDLTSDFSVYEKNRNLLYECLTDCGFEVVPLMLHRHSGRILNISSVWGNVGASMETAYSASKGAVNSLTRALAKELAPSNIAVNAIACGVIDTDMNRCFSEEELQALIEEIPADRLGQPEEVGLLALKLAESPLYLTGQIITMDGGFL